MAIAIVEPFYTGSHQKWCEQLKEFVFPDTEIFSLPGRFWKWRMHGAAITLANQLNNSEKQFESIIASDMLHLPLFKSLLKRQLANLPISLYFHENQFAYPWSPDDRDVELNRDDNYRFINYISALSADKVFFNSEYNMHSFFKGVEEFLNKLPDFQNHHTLKEIESKSKVLPLGIDLKVFDQFIKERKYQIPVILWNHRWEYDKNPTQFYRLLKDLKLSEIDFQLIILGESTTSYPVIFNKIKDEFSNEIVHWGYADNFESYAHLISISTHLPVTSNQDFFGISVVEAIYCGVIPLLPNRLAFPEHLAENSDEFVYSNEKEMLEKFKAMLYSPEDYRSLLKPTINQISEYDWEKMRDNYLVAFK